mmetsp:Transcript_21381/g.73378  ORF Transcript_21381/g.73378 Transcript_21381/m.73378 type:complete len:100 (-) Transcript_21381:134-433(-)
MSLTDKSLLVCPPSLTLFGPALSLEDLGKIASHARAAGMTLPPVPAPAPAPRPTSRSSSVGGTAATVGAGRRTTGGYGGGGGYGDGGSGQRSASRPVFR